LYSTQQRELTYCSEKAANESQWVCVIVIFTNFLLYSCYAPNKMTYYVLLTATVYCTVLSKVIDCEYCLVPTGQSRGADISPRL
jgi:hypothetical protein